MKRVLYIAVAVLVILFVLSFFKDMVVKVSVEKGVEMITGLKMGIRGFNIGLLKTAVRIKGLKIYNPGGYKERVMLDMPEIYVDYDLPAAFKGMIHLEDALLDMKELVVVKNEKGELNLNSLNVVKSKKSGKTEKAAAGKEMNIRIDRLRLKIGKAVYKDYSRPGEPSIKEFNINTDETYENIDNPSVLVSLIIVKALSNTSIAGMANFDLGSMKSNISGTLATAHKAAIQATEALKGTKETVGKASETLQNVFKNPFGGK